MDNKENEVNENVENKANEVNNIDSVENATSEVKQETAVNNETKTEKVEKTEKNENEGPIKEKKKSNTGLIVTIVILAVVVIVLLFVGIYSFMKSKINSLVDGEALNEVTTMLEEGQNSLQNAEDLLENGGLNDVFGSLTNAVDNSSTAESSSDAKTSSLEKPLKVGKWGIASKYNTNTKSDQNVNVRVSKIIRGDEAKKMAQEYMNSDSSIYKYEDPEAYQEWLVVEYDVDFGDTYIPGELGASPNVQGDVTGPDGKSIKYNGISYINSVIEIGSRDYIKTKTGSGMLLTQIPIGCTDYIIDFGTYNGTHAYFQGQ